MKKREVCDQCGGGVEESRTAFDLTTCSSCELNQEVAEPAPEPDPVLDDDDGED